MRGRHDHHRGAASARWIARAAARAAASASRHAGCLSSSLAPRTNRIYYDEQIYLGIAQNLTDLRLAQMCNDGTVEYGRLQCWRGEFNKEPNGYPYLLSLVYRVVGVGERTAFIFNNLVAAVSAFPGRAPRRDAVRGHRYAAVLSGLVLSLLPMQLWWTNTAAAEPSAAMMVCGGDGGRRPFHARRAPRRRSPARWRSRRLRRPCGRNRSSSCRSSSCRRRCLPRRVQRLRLWWAAPAGRCCA